MHKKAIHWRICPKSQKIYAEFNFTHKHNASPHKYILVFIFLPFVDGSLTVKAYLPQKLPKWTKLYVHRSLLLIFFKWDTLWPDGFNFSLKKKKRACRNLDLKVYTCTVTKKKLWQDKQNNDMEGERKWKFASLYNINSALNFLRRDLII